MCLCNSIIVYVINTLEVGGAGKNLRFVASNSTSKFKKVIIISLYDSIPIKPVIDGVEYINLGIIPKGLGWRLYAIIKLRMILKSIKPQLVCSFLSDISVITRLASIGLDLLFVSAERGDPYTLPFKWKIPVYLTYVFSDYCIFQLEGARNYFCSNVQKKSFIIPNPYATFERVNPFYGQRRNTIIGVGRLEEQKGFDVLIKAFSIVIKKHPEYKLIIYGDGSLRMFLNNLIKELKLNNNVILPGYIEDVSSVIREDGIFVLPSRFEGIPNVLIEAMALGIPTVSTNCTPGGAAFLTKNGERGVLVEVNDYINMANAINMIIENRAYADTLSKKGREIVSELDTEKIKTMWLDTLKRIIDRN